MKAKGGKSPVPRGSAAFAEFRRQLESAAEVMPEEPPEDEGGYTYEEFLRFYGEDDGRAMWLVAEEAPEKGKKDGPASPKGVMSEEPEEDEEEPVSTAPRAQGIRFATKITHKRHIGKHGETVVEDDKPMGLVFKPTSSDLSATDGAVIEGIKNVQNPDYLGCKTHCTVLSSLCATAASHVACA
jgi:hypothetical protein